MQDTTLSDRLIAAFAQLRSELQLPESDDPDDGGPPQRTGPLPIELGLSGVILDQINQTALLLGVPQALLTALFGFLFYKRRERQQELEASVAVLLAGSGIYDSGTPPTAVARMARKELIRRGMSESRADEAAAKVLEWLGRELSLLPDTTDEEASQALIGKLQELVTYFPGWKFQSKDYGCWVSVPLPNDRAHRVHVIPKGKDVAGRPLVEFQAICGEMNPDFLKTILRKSGQLETGGYAIRKVEGVDYFSLQERLRLDTIPQGELGRIIPYLAQHADAVEAELYPGQKNRF